MKILLRQGMKALKKVRHSNELNATLSNIPVNAKRVLFLALSQVNPRNELDLDETIYVTVNDFCGVTETDSKNAYRNLKEGADVLSKIGLRLEKEELNTISKELGLGGKTPDYMNLNLMEYCVYFKEEGRVGIKFTKSAGKYISSIVGAEKKYTAQALISVVVLNMAHSTNLYQLIRKKIGLSPRFSNGFEITVNDLKKELGLVNDKNEYLWPDYPIFKRDVLNKAIKEVNEKTEIYNLSFTVCGKVGRKVDKLFFRYKTNEGEFSKNMNGLSDEDEAFASFLEDFDKNIGEE